MSDVEQWLKSCVSEYGREESISSKEELWISFSTLTKVEVGRELFILFFLSWNTTFQHGLQEFFANYNKKGGE